MTGRKIQLRSDPSIAEPHAAGAKITLVQPALHHTYGALFVPRPNYWRLHLETADHRARELAELDRRVLSLPMEKSDSRTLDDELTQLLYRVGSDLILQTVLTLQQLVLEIELAAKIQPHAGDNLNTRLGNALKATGFAGDLGKDERYGQFAELQRVRDAIEHPAETNVYNPDQARWDEVPLAWIASGKALRAFELTRDLIAEIERHYADLRKKSARPGTLEVERGLRALHPFKKPVRTAAEQSKE